METKLVMAEPKEFIDAIGAISHVVSEVGMKINKEGLEIIAMDPANVAMVGCKINSKMFVELKADEEITAGVKLTDLKPVLKRTGKNDILALEFVDGQIKVTISGKSKKTYELRQIEIEQKDTKFPPIDYKSVIKMDSEEFSEGLADAGVASELTCALITENQSVKMAAAGDLTTSSTDMKAEIIKNEAPTKSKYSLEYLGHFLPGLKIAKRITLSYSTDVPLQIEASTDRVEMKYLLAPRIDEK